MKAKILHIMGIYCTNSYDDGVGIQASRFNHSCSPNAEFEWDESISASGIRTVSKIYYNQEITVNYRPEEIRSNESSPEVSMTSFDERQEILKTLYGFECHCHLCKKESGNL